MGRKVWLMKVLGKVVWVREDLFAKWYVRDREKFDEGEGEGMCG
jgi:hypothetical protein